MKTTDDPKTLRVAFLLIAIAIIIAALVFCSVLVGCEDTPAVPRAEPIVWWVFESPDGVPSLDLAHRAAISSAYFEQGEIVTLPSEWETFVFLVPKRMVTVPYLFQWRPPGEEWTTLAIATVDSMQSGIVWFVGKDVEPQDQIRLNLPWEGYQ